MAAWRPLKQLTKAWADVKPMWRGVFLYALALGLGAFVLQWLQYNYLVRAFAPELYIGLIAVAFTALGIWAGYRLTPKAAPVVFARNDAAIKSLSLTDREVRVLELLAEGQANKEIARTLDVSPNTVKTHIANLFQKLDAERRTQAIQKARELKILP